MTLLTASGRERARTRNVSSCYSKIQTHCMLWTLDIYTPMNIVYSDLTGRSQIPQEKGSSTLTPSHSTLPLPSAQEGEEGDRNTHCLCGLQHFG